MLLTRALNRFHIRGIALRQPSLHGLGCIMVLRWLLTCTDDRFVAQGRLLSALCAENLRFFVEQGVDPPPL